MDTPAPPPLEETLRTLGALLDATGAAIAKLELSPRGVTLRVPGEPSARHLALRELQQALAGRRAVRGHTLPAAPARRERYEPLLRVVGMLLAGAPAESYELVVAPELVLVRDSTGRTAVFLVEQLAALARGAARRRRPARQADRPGGPGGG
jgi:hypothetical protein